MGAKLRECRLFGQWHGVMNERLDSSGAERGLRRRALGTPDGKQVIDMAGIALLDGTQPGVERTAVLMCQFAATLGPGAEIRQTGAENRGLHLVEPAVHARLRMDVAIGLASIAKPLEALGNSPVVCDRRAAVPQRAEILRRVEAERAADAEGPDGRTAPGGEMRLAAVL